MKTIFILLFSLCSTIVFAQASQYFIVKDGTHFVELTLKNATIIEEKHPCNNEIQPKGYKKLMAAEASVVREAFGQVNGDELKLLKKVRCIITIGPRLRVYAVRFEIPKTQFEETMKMEKKLYGLSRQFISWDMSPYFQVKDEALFQSVQWSIGRLDNLFNYTPDNNIIIPESEK